MASVTSGEVQCSSYIWARAVVEYSGTWATAYIQYQHRAGGYTGYTGWFDYGAGGSSASGSWSNETITTSWETKMSIGFSISTGGGEYGVWCSGYSYNDFSLTVYIPAQYTAPSSISGSTLSSGNVCGRAKVSVSVGNWGTSSSSNVYRAYKQPSVGSEWGHSSSSAFTFDGLTPSTSSVCAISTWYPGATNNHDLSAASTTPRYIASPADVNFSARGNNRASAISSTVSYRGGLTSAQVQDTAQLTRYLLYYRRAGDSWPELSNPQQNIASTAKSCSFNAVSYETFATGYDYDFRICPVNTYGAYAKKEFTIVKPSNLNVVVDTTAPQQPTLTLSAVGGGINGDGTIAGYQIEYGTTTSYSTTLPYDTSPEQTISDLALSTTYYYRVTAWNNYGLSIQTTGSFRTPDYYAPVVSNVTWTATGTGIRVQGTVTKTGGVSEDSDTIRSIILRFRPVNSLDWEHTISPFSPGRTIDIRHEGGYQQPGDYTFQLVVTNSSGASTIINQRENAPSVPTVSDITSFHNYPNAFQCTGTVASSGDVALAKWRLDTVSPNTTTGAEQSTSATTVTELRSALGLMFNASYTANVKAWNRYGLWNQSASFSFTTRKYLQFYLVNETYPASVRREVTPYFRLSNAPTTSRSIGTAHFIVADALSSLTVGQDVSDCRLRFIEEPLFYTEDSVASMLFTNGKTIAFAQDTDGLYKFGIWSSGTLQTTFFDGLEWQLDHYDLTGNWEVQSIVQSSRGLAQAHSFATTSCKPIHYGD